MDYTQLIIRKREDINKVFLFFPHTGIILETECRDTRTLYDLLKLLRSTSIEEIKKICQSRKIHEDALKQVEAIYKDLESMDINFDKG